MDYMLLLPVFLPILAGIVLLLKKEYQERKSLLSYVGIVLVVTGILAVYAMFSVTEGVTLFYLTKTLPVYFKADMLGRFFALVVTIVWILAGFFSFEYMKHEKNEKRYFGFYLITYGVLLGLDFAGNLVTLYLFYEMMTLLSMPLVLHTQTRESVMAGLKYLFYSFAGAYMALFGIYFVYKHGTTLEFTAGGVIDAAVLQENGVLFLVVTMLMLIGFGVKAGMFPMHAWLPTAHPVAPGPASAVLSGIIVKGGVLAIIRVVYQIIGVDFLRGTWVQAAWMVLTLITVFMGSLLAFGEPVLKKRLAYSTVSQLSYILFGLSVMEPQAMTGSLLHVAAHAFIKVALFLCAGAIIYRTGCTRVEELKGIGKGMPITLWCYTIVSLGLIGIPPTSGFVSKWHLAMGALSAEIPVFSWLGPVILLVSALLTAGYLLPITMQGFFPGEGFDASKFEKKEPNGYMLVPLVIFAALTIVIGVMPNVLTDVFMIFANGVM
ncbi:MAG: proton-conducting membrane transporter [Lachnospiraceae bacterium]|nr:proton-conducting membrane transporter [Lachnospiraceae bacterium]